MNRSEGGNPLETIRKAIEIGERTNSATRLCYALQVMGDYYRKQDKPEEAIHYYNNMLKLAQKHDYKKKEYLALFRLSQCYETVDEQEFHRMLAQSVPSTAGITRGRSLLSGRDGLKKAMGFHKFLSPG